MQTDRFIFCVESDIAGNVFTNVYLGLLYTILAFICNILDHVILI